MREERGVSLIEVIIGLLIITIAALALLQLAAHLVILHQASLDRWNRAVETWNEAETFRIEDSEEELFRVTDKSGLLRRRRIPSGGGEDWEVIHEAR